MTKSRAIRMKCLDCCGGGYKEVKICNIFDCPLWPFRLGFSMKSPRYMKAMEGAKREYADEFEELAREGVDFSLYFKEPTNKRDNSGQELQTVDENAAPPPVVQAPTNKINRFPKKEDMVQGDEDELPPLLKAMMAADK